MDYLYLSVAVIAVAFIDFLLFYCLDDTQLWSEEDYNFPLSMPTIFDLDGADPLTIDGADPSTIDRYVRTMICLAHEYFQLRSELLEANERRTSSPLFLWVFLESFSCFILVSALIPVVGHGFICLLPAVSICALALLLSRAIYQRTAKIPTFSETKSTLAERFAQNPRDFGFPISPKSGLNLYMIHYHYNYLLSIRKTLRKRATVHSVIVFFAAILYLFWGFFRYDP